MSVMDRLTQYGNDNVIDCGQCIRYLHQMVLEIGFIELGKASTNKFNFINHWCVHIDRMKVGEENKMDC